MCFSGLISLTLAAVAQNPAAIDTKVSAKLARQVLERCGADDIKLALSPDEDWTPAVSAESKHQVLRKSLNEPMPTSSSFVSIHAIGGDLGTTEFSVILARKLDGTWVGTAVGQSTIWIQGAQPTAMPRKEWTLPPIKGQRLDTLLHEKCYYAEPTTFFRKQAPGVGSIYMSVETRTRDRQRRFSYDGNRVEGLSKEVTELTFPPPS